MMKNGCGLSTYKQFYTIYCCLGATMNLGSCFYGQVVLSGLSAMRVQIHIWNLGCLSNQDLLSVNEPKCVVILRGCKRYVVG